MSINYDAPPTVSQFMLSDAFVRVIVGPVGSGKTTGLIMEILRRALQQAKGPDGVRRTRFAIIRQTLLQLRMTILLDILSWLRPICEYKVSEQLVIISFGDVRSEWFLIPLEEEEDQKRLLSMQLTGAAINEAIEINPSLIDAIAGRCGRFPSALEGGASWFGVIADTNAPIEGSDWWKLFEQDRPPDWAVFFQPGGLEPNAENLDWLLQTPVTLQLPPGDPARRQQGRTYYERLARGKNEDWIRRYVHAKYGEDPSGAAVYRLSYRRSFHVKQGLLVLQTRLLLIGQDFGRNPCSLICQPDGQGRLSVLEEVIGEDIGLETHIQKNLKPVLWSERYFGCLMAAVGDPSGVAKGNFLEETSFDVMHRMGIPAFPATTNDLDPRIGAVETLLLQQRDGGPAIVFDEGRCPQTIRAIGGAYRFSKTKQGATKPTPDKSHPFSDLADCLQYVCLALNSGLTNLIVRRIMPRRPKARTAVPSAAGWT